MRKILAVDDDSSILKLLQLFLREKYELAVVGSGQEALEYLSKSALPDLILLDVQMPEMSGVELKSKLDEHPQWKNIPIIYLSADDHNMDRVDHKFNFDFLNKPFKKDDLLFLLETFFNYQGK